MRVNHRAGMNQAVRAQALRRQFRPPGRLAHQDQDRDVKALVLHYGDTGQFDGGAAAFPHYYWAYWGPIVLDTLVPIPPIPGTGFNYYYVADSYDAMYRYLGGRLADEAIAVSAAIIPPDGGGFTNGPSDRGGYLFGVSDSDALDVPPDFARVVAVPVHLSGSRPSRVGTLDLTSVIPVPVDVHLSGTRPHPRVGEITPWERPLPAPLNDNIEDALVMDPYGGIDTPDLTWATIEQLVGHHPPSPPHTYPEPDWELDGATAIHTVWYSYTAPADGVLTLQFGPVNNGEDPYPRLFVGAYQSNFTSGGIFPLTMLVEANTEREVEDAPGGGGLFPGGSLYPGVGVYPSGSPSLEADSPATGVLSFALEAGTQVYIRMGPEDITPYTDIDPTTNVPYGPGPAALLWFFVENSQAVGGGSVVGSSYDSTDAILTPGSLDITVGNLPPSASIFWSIDSPSAPSFGETDVPDNGTLINYSVLIPESLAPGTHTLYGNVSGGGLISFVFTVATDNPPDATEDDVEPVLIPRSGVQRWVFQDPTGTIPSALTGAMTLLDGAASYVVPLNPAKMNAPFTQKQITTETTVGVNGNAITWESNQQAPSLQFSGVILDGDPADPTSYLNMLLYFLSLPYMIYVIDHFNRAWTGYVTSFLPVPAQSLEHPKRHTYDMTVQVFAMEQLS